MQSRGARIQDAEYFTQKIKTFYMKAVIRRGKQKGQVVTVSQWCNDWFSIEESAKIFSPTALAFDIIGMGQIYVHKNNGVLLQRYEMIFCQPILEIYHYSFKRRKFI